MKEKRTVRLIFIVLLVMGGVFFVLSLDFQLQSNQFTFYKTELGIEGNKINETLFFSPDEDYHTLFRNFNAQLYVNEIPEYTNGPVVLDYINLTYEECKTGNDYSMNYYGELYSYSEELRNMGYVPYIENNEYGCTFGEEYGFKQGEDYWIYGEYEIITKTLFNINNEHYIKFVAYSGDQHPYLKKGENFIINEGVTKESFLPNEQVDIYLPYEGSLDGFNIIEQEGFNFEDKAYWIVILNVLRFFAFMAPALIFIFIWRVFGKEKKEIDLPSTLSHYPTSNGERKAWEVASFFQPPFGIIDKDFFSSMMLSFYNRKIIDMKVEGKTTKIKISKKEFALDEVENKFLEMLKYVEKEKGKEFEDSAGYFNIEKALKKLSYDSELRALYMSIQAKIGKEKKKYFNSDFVWVFLSLSFLVPIAMFLIIFLSVGIFLFWIGFFILMGIISYKSALFTRYNADYYKEYREWQAFRNYLKSFPSMRTSPPEAVKLWDKYLVYATALGVSKEVLSKFKEWRIIDEKQYNTFVYSGSVSHSFSSATAARSSSSGGGGGFGGGGGMGGGGGGGR